MVPPSNTIPVSSDGRKEGGTMGNRSLGSRFEWVSSSPSPATVSELVCLFPDVVQAPIQALEEEISEWGSKAVIARSLSRWIPPEAIVRELRCAGVVGLIESISLAHRHVLLRFSDPAAKLMVLGNPWVVNGQVMAIEDWKPEFIPSESSLSSALLWIRLPSLPMEFWTETILSSILAVAGRFVFLDSATKEKKRGGYARACVQVDLRKPLRPGVRVRGTGLPFWQPFVFEHLEGFCTLCGALHSAEGCPSDSVKTPESSSPLYGPWMSAIRRRRTPQPAAVDSGLKFQKASASSSPNVVDGWQFPKKTARRKFQTSGARGSVASSSEQLGGLGVDMEGSTHGPPVGGSGNQAVEEGLQAVKGACQSLFTVPVQAESYGKPDNSLKIKPSIISANPFALLGSDKWAGRPKSRREANPGPLKRARPVESPDPRIGPIASKGKGKINDADKQGLDPTFTFSASLKVPKEVGALAAQGPLVTQASDVQPPGACAEVSQLLPPEHRSHDDVVSLLKKAMQVEVDGANMDSQVQMTQEGGPIDSSPPDTEMIGDRVGSPRSK